MEPDQISSGPLHLRLVRSWSGIDDDDRDVMHVVARLENEAALPMGGLRAEIRTLDGRSFQPQREITSLGPGVQRPYEWTFPPDGQSWIVTVEHPSVSGTEIMELGPFSSDYEHTENRSLRTANSMGATVFEDAFAIQLGDFGNVSERELIDGATVELTEFEAVDASGGRTLVLDEQRDAALGILDAMPMEASSGMTTSSGQRAREAPVTSTPTTSARAPPPTSLSRTMDPLLSHATTSPSKREAPPSSFQAANPVPEGEDPLLSALRPTPSGPPPSGPPGPPPSGPPGPPPSGPPGPPPSGPPGPPPSGPPGPPPTGPPGPPPSGPPGPPPTGPPGPPPSGPPGPPPEEPQQDETV